MIHTQEKLKKYEEFIKLLNKNLEQFFENQKEFIKCSAGCSICCEVGHFPMTELENEFLRIGFQKLDSEKRESIRKKAFELFRERKKFIKAKNSIELFSYSCPMLEKGLCSIYEHRPIICRVHGLITRGLKGGENYKLPACLDKGLNYANVWDENIKDFSLEKAKSLNIQSTPEAFEFGYEPLLAKFDSMLKFGDLRMLFEWIILDTPDYQKALDEINKEL